MIEYRLAFRINESTRVRRSDAKGDHKRKDRRDHDRPASHYAAKYFAPQLAADQPHLEPVLLANGFQAASVGKQHSGFAFQNTGQQGLMIGDEGGRADVVDDDALPTINDSTVGDVKPGLNKKRPGGNKVNANVPQTNPDGSIPGIPGTGPKKDPTGDTQAGTTNPDGTPIINKRPFVDLANNVNDLLDKNQVKLDSAFIVNASGKLTKDNRLDPKSFRYVQAASNDEKILEVVKESIEAINDSGYLQYLTGLSGKDFGLMLQQDDVNITGIVQSELESETRARSIKSSLDFAIGIAKSAKTGANADQNDKDDLILLEGAKIEVDGKKVVIRFVIPKQIALPMIQRKLAEQKAAPKQPNGNATLRPGDNTAKN